MSGASRLRGVNPQHIVLFHHFRAFLERAAKQGIDAAPLKGAHLLTSVYPEGEDRGPMADVDFLVRPADWDGALQILKEMGFVPRPPTRRPVSDREYHETAYYLDTGNGGRIMFEPHRRLAPRARLPIDDDALWERSTPSRFDGAPCRRLADDDHMLHGILHLAAHSFIAPQRSLRDITLLLTRGSADLDRVVAQAPEWGIRRAAWLTLALLREQTQVAVTSAHLENLAPVPPVERALRWLVPGAKGYRFPRMGLRAQQLVLWPLLFDSPRKFLEYAAAYARLRARDGMAHRAGAK